MKNINLKILTVICIILLIVLAVAFFHREQPVETLEKSIEKAVNDKTEIPAKQPEKKEVNIEEIRNLLNQEEGIILVDNIKKEQYPIPTLASGKDEVFVGRITSVSFTSIYSRIDSSPAPPHDIAFDSIPTYFEKSSSKALSILPSDQKFESNISSNSW